MAVLTRILFYFAALAVYVRCLPLDVEKRDGEISHFPSLGIVNPPSPIQSLIEHLLRQVETKLLRQFDTGFTSTTGLSGSPVVFPGIGTSGLTSFNPNLLPNPGFVTNTVVRPQGGGGGGGGFGNAIIGSIIGSALANIVPALLRPRLGLAAAALRDALNAPQNFDAYFMNMPGSKDAYLYLTQAENDIEDGVSNEETSFDFPSIPFEGTRIGTVNIKAPPSNLEIDDSTSGGLREDYKVYETHEKHDYKK